MFERHRLLDILKNFICFNVDGKKNFKILAGYHQYFAVKNAVESTKHTTHTDGKGGVFWHTQGSRKSLVVSRVGPVDKDEIWAEKLYSQPIFYPYMSQKRWP